MRHGLRAGASALIIAMMAGAVPAWADFWSDAGAKLQGVTLHGVTESTPPSNYVKNVLAPQFTEKTGISVEIETTSWDQMYDKAIKDMEAGTGIYDMVYIEQDIIYAYLARNFLVDITKSLKDDPSIKSPDFDESNFTSFANYFKNADGDLFGLPMEAFIKVYLYRTDLFNDPEIQAAFKEKTGHDLKPATTHEEYTEIAEFFTEYGKEKGLDLWGTTAQAHTGHPASWYEFFESVAPTFGVYNWGINAADNYGATVEHGGQMNSDKAKAALKYWLHLRDIAPPESAASTWTEVASTFAAGRAAQGLVYGENAAWIATDPEQSRVVGNVGVALPPLEPGVLEDAESGKGYIGYYDGGAFGMPITSRNKEATMLWLQFIGLESVQPEWAIAGSRVVMESTYSDPAVQEVNAKTDNYYTLMQEEGPLFRGAPDFPFHNPLRESIDPFIWQALSGEIEPGDALDQACAAAEAKMLELGYGGE